MKYVCCSGTQENRQHGERFPFSIRAAEIDDGDILPALENAAGMVFRTIPALAHLVDGEDLPVARYKELISKRASWVAVDSGSSLVAFLCGETERNVLHLWELGVLPAVQRRGLGRALVNHAIEFAKQESCKAITLTTFREVPWNAPFYESMGFKIVDLDKHERLSAILRKETKRGLEIELRCAMMLSLDERVSEFDGR
jgi:GNAT superfamily N-acetyltransferase